MTITEINLASDPTQAILDFTEQLLRASDGHHEQRTVRRHGAMVVAAAVPLDDDLQPAGKLFKIVTRDISTRGICLIHPQPIIHQHLKMKIPMPNGSQVNVIVEVMRCQPIGEFYEVGGRFVQRL